MKTELMSKAKQRTKKKNKKGLNLKQGKKKKNPKPTKKKQSKKL